MKKKKLKTLIKEVRIYSQDIGIQFSIERGAMLMRSGKQQMAVGKELPNQEKKQDAGRKGNVPNTWEICKRKPQTKGDGRKIKK